MGQARYISVCDIKSAYHQLAVKPEHQWLTAFVWDGGLQEYTRAPFGQRAVATVSRELVLLPLRWLECTSVATTVVRYAIA